MDRKRQFHTAEIVQFLSPFRSPHAGQPRNTADALRRFKNRLSAKPFPERGLHVTPGFFALLGVALLISPVEVTAAVLSAAALHECGHLAALALYRVPVEGLRLGAMGAVIHAPGARRLSYGRELAVTLAGPGVNLLCAPLLGMLSVRLGWAWGYLFAGAHTVLGVYNLLPISPLDGGRALYLLLAWRWGPDAGERIATLAGVSAAATLAVCGAYLTFTFGGALFLLAALGLLVGVLRPVLQCFQN